MEKAHIAEFEYDKHEIERALFFLSNALQDSGHNTKPYCFIRFKLQRCSGREVSRKM